MSEYTKQMKGEWFSYNDIELKKMRVHCSKVIFELNQIDNSQKDERFELLKNLFALLGKDTNIK